MAAPIDVETNIAWTKATFVEAVGKSPALAADSLFFSQELHDAAAGRAVSPFIHPLQVKEGAPAIIFSDEDLSLLNEEVKFTLIGKFSLGHPKMELVRNFFDSFHFNGNWTMGLLDGRHMLFNFSLEEDYARLFAKRTLVIAGMELKVIKWTPEFDPNKEPPVVPIWFKFPSLPYRYFNKTSLFQIARALGTPLQLDKPTLLKARPGAARILIERDISLPETNKIWIGTAKEGAWQEVIMEQKPFYCDHCRMFGHTKEKCYRLFPPSKKGTVAPKLVGTSTTVPNTTTSVEKDAPDHPPLPIVVATVSKDQLSQNATMNDTPSSPPGGITNCRETVAVLAGKANTNQVSSKQIAEMHSNMEGTWQIQTSKKNKNKRVEPLTVADIEPQQSSLPPP